MKYLLNIVSTACVDESVDPYGFGWFRLVSSDYTYIRLVNGIVSQIWQENLAPE